MSEVTLTVKGMTCGECVQKVEKALAGSRGVERAMADLETGHVKVEYEEDLVGNNQIKKTIEQTGYEVE
ncbi:heavy-metal-associated domain-containing protein [Pseudalkalibacillus salsuginis]|uniref:heavy-metal-associated domain-containing protein n=1 Tax=Pseudalkalibacillus salsuginis TaxID=2910972 RepID=UPI001F2227C7|nr:cation transporter [Pseudalkalibacillus salsuginis]MCF6411458.1 cation transporter [Pseudalkalibacillus salsuginis]